ncbi:MAG: hypothetical protein JWQ16_2704 [Novosphingobium sp.]|nr:hypothetical protein [Novosphingobium sp.]
MTNTIEMTPELDAEGRVKAETWPLPLGQASLEVLFRDLFENHWDKLTFGPMIQGGAYELRCPGPPKSINVSAGYFTVHWGRGGHFHLCIGESHAEPDVVAHRRPSKVELVRGLDKEGHPVTWSLRAENGRGESTLSIYFPNPFIRDEDGLADAPDWSRLALWHDVLARYAGTAPDGRDTLSKGFRG